MGLRCSLLGHDFGEPEIEREREERGNEVIETVREVKTCEHCGSESVVSENTEVRSIKPNPMEASEESDEADEAGSDEGSGLQSAVQRVDDSGASGVADELDDVSAAEDDGVILEDDDTDDADVDRDPGQWPDADDTRQEERDAMVASDAADANASAPGLGEDDTVGDADAAVEADAGATPDANPGGDDEGAVDADDDGDAEFIDADAESGAMEDREPWPETQGDDEGFDAQSSTEGGVDLSDDVEPDESYESEDGDVQYVEAGFESAGSLDPEGSGGTGGGDALVCPQCGHETEANGSSLRAGDICPECRKGYLAEE